MTIRVTFPTRSVLDPTSAQNALNPQAGRFQYKVWHYLSSATNWFLIDTGLMKQALTWYDRVPLEFGPESLDSETMQFKMLAYNRFSRGFSDWRWVYGCGV